MNHKKSLVKEKIFYNPFQSGEIHKAVPSTEAQREMWASIAMDKNATLCYNESISIVFEGFFDVEVFNRAFSLILERHDSLRAVFSRDGKTLFVNEYKEQPLKVLDFNLKSIEDFELLKNKEVQTKFNLELGPCYRAALVKIDKTKHCFIFTAHHIICDGWSFGILLNELSLYYTTLVNKQHLPIENAAQFADFAISEYKDGVDLTHKKYWLNEFSRALTDKSLPIDFKRPSFRTFDSARFDFEIPTTTVQLLKKLAGSNGCSFYGTLMSIFNVLIHKISSSEDIVIGMASAAQSSMGQNDLFGHMVNLLPLRTNINEELAFNILLKSIRSKMYDAFEHQFYSYGTLVKDLKNIKRDPSQMPLLSIVFNIDQQSADQGLSFEGVNASYKTTPRICENFEIFINAVSFGNRLILECQYNTNLFALDTIKNWIVSYLELMELIIKNPSIKISDYKLSNLKIPVPVIDTSIKKTITLEKRNIDQETILKKIWANVLLTESLEIEDNFFSVGGHSLLAIELAEKITEHFKISFTIKDVFENPTIVSMSNKISGDQKNSVKLLPELQQLNMSSFPLSYNQMHVWYLEEMFPDRPIYNLPASFRIKMHIDRSILEKSIHFIIERQSSLRTAIVTESGLPQQKILSKDLPCFKPKLELVKTNEEEVSKIMNKLALMTLNKTTPPLFFSKLFQLSENDFIFFFVVNHIIWDGWSFDIFFQELNITYSAFINNREPSFHKNPEITYIDYSAWFQKLLSEKYLDKQLEYWVNKLKTPLPVLDLPLDYKRPLEITYEGDSTYFTLSDKEADLLREYAKKNETSLFNVFLTAYKITLSNYAGIDDIIVGLPVRCRTKPELLQTIGFFVNVLAIRSKINLNLTFKENLHIVTQNSIDAYENQLIPFQLVLNKINPPKDNSRYPVFQVLFSYQDVNNRSPELNGVPYVQNIVDKSATNAELDFWVKASDKKIEGGFDFRKDLFNTKFTERFTECLLNLIYEAAIDDSVPLNAKSAIPLKQRDLILKSWNKTSLEIKKNLSFHQMFEEYAKISPNAIAIESSKESITYELLDRLSNRCANSLLLKGVTKGELVGISLSRNINLLVAILGVLKAGAGYVPLDPAFPQDRLDYMSTHSKLKLLITENEFVNRFTNGEHKILISEATSELYEDKISTTIDYDSNESMYVIYTSGSTGKPKGVEITHHSVTNFLVSMKNTFKFTPKEKILAVTTLSFDIAVLELFLPLSTGATIFLANSRETIDGQELKRILENKNITTMQATPMTWRLLLASGWKGNNQLKVLCGGEAFPIDLAKTLIPICQEVWNMYGPTETTVWSACKRLELNDDQITIGKPIANTLLYILNENHQMLPIGAIGELFIAGDGLAKGYYGRPDLTNDRFFSDPFIPGKNMYATGDLARFTTTGEVICLGRNDGQVKVRGYRIELGEIEEELQKINGINEAVAITSEYRPGDIRIFAYLTTKNLERIDEKLIRVTLAQKLPAYMIPSTFTVLDEIPKTLNGKIDRKALPKVEAKELVLEKVTIDKPEVTKNSNREIIREIWKDILGVSELKDTDNFFDIGGNSILAVGLIGKVSSVFKINLSLATLIQADNFLKFSDNLESQYLFTSSQNNTEKSTIANIPSILKTLISIKMIGNKNPLYSFHGVGGNVLNYVTLIPALKNERPLFALQSLGLDGITPPLRSIQEMANYYLREIKIAQPEGPYLLSGGSMGGMIAFEVALLLQKRGEKIEKLIMFDTFGPDLNIKSFTTIKKESYFKEKFESLMYRFKFLLNNIQVSFYRNIGLPVPMTILLTEIEKKNYQALWKYTPTEQFDGDLFLIRAPLTDEGVHSDPLMGWSKIIKGKIYTFEIDGDHSNFIESPELVKTLTKII